MATGKPHPHIPEGPAPCILDWKSKIALYDLLRSTNNHRIQDSEDLSSTPAILPHMPTPYHCVFEHFKFVEG